MTEADLSPPGPTHIDQDLCVYVCVHCVYVCVHCVYVCVHCVYVCVHCVYVCVHVCVCIKLQPRSQAYPVIYLLIYNTEVSH